LHEVAYPLLLKPRRGGNGVGIVRCHHAAEVTAYLDARPHLWNQVVIQTEVAGWDIDCSVLCANGKIVAHTIQRPLVRSSSDFKPAPAVEFIEDEGALSVVGRLMAALGWTGVAHVDMRYDVRGNITILEVNPRFWGSLPGSVQAGVNFPYLAVLLALGRPLPPVRSMPCRYIAGGAAFRALFQGRRPTFRISQTPWLDMVRDPGPTLQELWSAASASVAGR
jgi:predicted ATP-grasp superfamily ATP-dependent carboligase